MASSPTTTTGSRDDTRTLTVDLEGMHCASCVSRVETALLGVDGVEEAAANLAAGRATISGTDLDFERIAEAVDGAGYAARQRSDRDGLSRATLAVEGMHCASCVSRVEGALGEVDGVSEASVNLPG